MKITIDLTREIILGKTSNRKGQNSVLNLSLHGELEYSVERENENLLEIKEIVQGFEKKIKSLQNESDLFK